MMKKLDMANALIVLGMHRSGTSCVSNLLYSMGGSFSSEGKDTLLNAENPKGFWEHPRLRLACNQLLQSCGNDWWSVQGFSVDSIPAAPLAEARQEFSELVSELGPLGTWFIKEPRLCLVLPAFRDQIAAPVIVHVWRDPVEVAVSLGRRNGFALDFGVALWEKYTRSAFQSAHGLPSVIVSYNDLLNEPQCESQRLLDKLSTLGVSGMQMPDQEIVLDVVDSALHRNVPLCDASALLSEPQLALLNALKRGDVTDPAFNQPLSVSAAVRLDDAQSHEAAMITLQAQAAVGRKIEVYDQRRQGETKRLNAEIKRLESLNAEIKRLESLNAGIKRLESLNAGIKSQNEILALQIEEIKGNVAGGANSIKDHMEAQVGKLIGPLRAVEKTLVTKNSARLVNRIDALKMPTIKYLYYRFIQRRSDADVLVRIMKSGVFDPAWYLKHNPDVAEARLTPLIHYIDFGLEEGRAPCPSFNASYYLSIYDDVASSNLHPFAHYALFGKDEGRICGKEDRSPAKQKGRPGENSSYFHVASEFVAKIEPEEQREKLARYIDYKKSRMAKYVVYTANVGDYDGLYIPEFLDLDTDYICFTDAPKDTHGVWEVRPLPWIDKDLTRSARFVKLNPHYLLPEYEYSIWIDGNILLRCSTQKLVDSLGKSDVLATRQHPTRGCVYEEVKACIEEKKDDVEILSKQGERYRRENLPENFHLYETNVFVMRHNDSKCIDFMNAWWAELNRFSRRDQISLVSVVFKLGYGPALIVPNEFSARNHPAFALFQHTREKGHIPLPFLAEFSHVEDPWQLEPFDRTKFIKSAENVTVDIVVCVHNALDDVRACLSSVVETVNPELHRVIIVDDGSDAATKEFLEEFSKANAATILIRNDVAQRYTKAANIGVKASTSDWVIMLNSDTIVTKSWVEKLVATGLSSPYIGMVGPLSNAASYQSIPSIKGENGQTAINELPKGKTIDDLGQFCERVSYNHYAPDVPLLHGCCLAISRKVIDEIGLFDEISFPNGFGEENDYCFRAADAGFKLVVATSTYIFHAKTKSYTPETRLQLAKKSGSAFSDKHGKDRVGRAVQAFESNTVLAKIRGYAEKYYSFD